MPMDISKLDKLESSILILIDRLSKVKNENTSLKNRISQMEKENAMLTKEREAVKLKVDSMLKNLEGLGIEGNEIHHTG